MMICRIAKQDFKISQYLNNIIILNLAPFISLMQYDPHLQKKKRKKRNTFILFGGTINIQLSFTLVLPLYQITHCFLLFPLNLKIIGL